LESLSIGRVLRNTLLVLRSRWLLLLPVSLGLAIVSLFADLYLATGVRTAFLRYGMPSSLIDFFYISVVNGALTAVIGAMFRSVLEAVFVRPVSLAILGQREPLLAALQSMVPALLPGMIAGVISTLLASIGWAFLVVPGVALSCAWMVAIPALINERLGFMECLGRSAELTEGNRWRVLALLVIYGVLVTFWSASISAIILTFREILVTHPLAVSWASDGFYCLSVTIDYALFAIAVTCLYVELRQLKEGVEPGDMARVFE